MNRRLLRSAPTISCGLQCIQHKKTAPSPARASMFTSMEEEMQNAEKHMRTFHMRRRSTCYISQTVWDSRLQYKCSFYLQMSTLKALGITLFFWPALGFHNRLVYKVLVRVLQCYSTTVATNAACFQIPSTIKCFQAWEQTGGSWKLLNEFQKWVGYPLSLFNSCGNLCPFVIGHSSE